VGFKKRCLGVLETVPSGEGIPQRAMSNITIRRQRDCLLRRLDRLVVAT
jgi:hypothetical protein